MDFIAYEGATLPELVREVTQVDINRYAQASGDFNPIHIDEAFAAATPLKGTIAHGMMVLAFVSELMARTFGGIWDESGRLSVKFRIPTRPGDTLTVSGQVEALTAEDDIVWATCALTCRNQKGEAVVTGEARVKAPTLG